MMRIKSSSSVGFAVWLVSALLHQVGGQTECIANPSIAADFNDTEGSCCMVDVCGIPCPEPVTPPAVGFGIVIGVGIIISFVVGVATLFLVHGEAENFFIAGRSLPLWIVSMTLGAQSIDSNSILGNADLSYKYHFYDGVVLPIGLGLSLILNGLLLARHINAERNVLTLPDVFSKRYGRVVEVLVSIAAIVSFMMLLAGNFVGMGVVLAYVWGFSLEAAIWTTFVIVWAYTVSGGLFSVAYTDVVQGIMGWSGCAVFVYWMIANQDPKAPPPSIGFPGYVYPDLQGDGGICDMYQGIPCTNNATLCCYNADVWCPSDDNCTTDNGAYPIGDQPIFSNQMTDYLALAPYPNAILWNWTTIIILALGNLSALDFQARCMAAKTPSIASYGCIIGGLFTFFVGIPFAYMGAMTRVYYGPDSVHASFSTDTCNPLLGLPTCALWEPDANAFMHLLTHDVPPFIGGWCMLGIVTASMSTADGAILAMGTVFAHNIVRQLDVWRPDLISAKNLLMMTRLATIPLSIASTCIAAYYTSDNPQGATGYLLIVAFDIMLATCVVPLFACFYCNNPSPNAALFSILAGATTRIVLEFTLRKDGYLLLPYDVPEFQDVGPAASSKFPVFFDEPAENLWNPDEEVCDTRQFEDFTGVDSLSALLVSFLVFSLIQVIERLLGRPMFNLPGLQPYEKNIKTEEVDDLDKSEATKPTESEAIKPTEPHQEEVEMAQKEDSEE